jgi:hypothetical protein
MKKIYSTSVFPMMMILIIIFSSCKKHKETPEPPTASEKTIALLTASGGRWSPPASVTNWVTVEGVNVSDLFRDFTITFTETGYTTTGTTPVWPRTDSWHFKDDTATTIVRDSDGKEVTIETLDETTLKITLTWDQTTYDGRTKSVAGKHVFNLTK